MRQWLRWPHRRPSFTVKISFLLGLGLTILLAVGVVAYRSIDVLVESARFESNTQSELVKAEMAVGCLYRAETAQRKYLATGGAEELSAFRTVRAQCEAITGDLRSTAGDTDQRRRLNALQAALTERLQSLEQQTKTKPADTKTAAMPTSDAEILRLDRRIEFLVDEFRLFSSRALQWRREETVSSADATGFMILWGTAFAVALLAWAMLVLHRHQAGRQTAERALRASEAQLRASEVQLRVITNTVPAFIGYVDRAGRLQFHNRTIELWLGRDAPSIRGRTLRELFGDEAHAGIERSVREVMDGKAVQCEFSLQSPDGRLRDVSAQLVPDKEESELVQGYYVLGTDISALREVGRLKSEFVATVSHELRTPLTSIRGSLGMLAGGVTGALPDKARQLVTIAMENSERLVRLINDILDSEKLLDTNVPMNVRDVDVAALVERTISQNEGFAGTHGVRLAWRTEGTAFTTVADSDRLAQVVTNLISNACKFSPQDGEVEILLHSAGGQMELSVNDRGPGVPEELRGRLFQRFAQLDSSDGRRRAGTGLGLNICRSIIERLGGSIGYRPREGGGSTFYFSLPATSPTGASGATP